MTLQEAIGRLDEASQEALAEDGGLHLCIDGIYVPYKRGTMVGGRNFRWSEVTKVRVGPPIESTITATVPSMGQDEAVDSPPNDAIRDDINPVPAAVAAAASDTATSVMPPSKPVEPVASAPVGKGFAPKGEAPASMAGGESGTGSDKQAARTSEDTPNDTPATGKPVIGSKAWRKGLANDSTSGR
tara:strand:- start:354 stop:911 length:558 start_codon:yes stop_codon:yes gene_type:complete